jgi:formylglycine-generating enzyme required for sulfatase activity
LRIVSPAVEPRLLTREEALAVEVEGRDEGELRAVSIAGKPAATRGAAGRFALSVPLPTDGEHKVVAEAQDAAGNAASAHVIVIRDRAPPVLSLSAPPVVTKAATGTATLRGTVEDSSGATVSVNGKAAEIAGRNWVATVPVDATTRVLRVEARDRAGNEAEPIVRLLAAVDEPHLAIAGFTYLGTNPQGRPEYVHNPSGIVLVLLEPAEPFWMGGSESEADSFQNERPRHQVLLDAFLIAKYELSQREWKQVMGTEPSSSKGDHLPVENISWEDAKAFSAKAGLALPTEAQWEYACRAGTDTPFAFGAAITSAQANYDGSYPYGGAARGPSRKRSVHVDSFEPNGFGLYNTHGNVEEWCEDAFDADFYQRSALGTAARRNPVSSSGTEGRVVRGGSWDDRAAACRSAYRGRATPTRRYNFIGLRPALQVR